MQTEALRPVDLNSVGVLSPRQADLPEDLWVGSQGPLTPRQTLISLYDLLSGSPIPALADVTRRVLVVQTASPGGAGTPEAALDARLQALLRSGLTTDLRDLVKALPSAAQGAEVQRVVAESQFIDGDMAPACVTTRDQLNRTDLGSELGTFWQKAAVVCGLLAPDPAAISAEQGSMQLGLLRDMGEAVHDPLFFWAAERFTGLRMTAPDTVSPVSPLAMVLVRASGGSLPPHSLVRPQGWLARTLAVQGKTVDATRLVAGEEAFARGVIDRDAWATLLKTVVLPADMTAKTPATLAQDASIMATAALWQAMGTASSVDAKAVVLQAAWQQAVLRHRAVTAAKLYAPDITGWTPTPQLILHAPVIVRVLLGDDLREAALPWFQALEQAVSSDRFLTLQSADADTQAAPAGDKPSGDKKTVALPTGTRHGDGVTPAQSAVARLWVLDRLANPQFLDAVPGNRLSAWRAAWSDPIIAARQEQRLLSLFDGTGDQVEAGQWAALWAPALTAQETHSEGSSDWHVPASVRIATRQAVDAHHWGEAIVLTVAGTGGHDLRDLDPADMAAVVRDLALAGLDDDSRRLAVQTALAWGL